MKLEDVKDTRNKKVKGGEIAKMLMISKEQDEFLKKYNISISVLTRKTIDEIMAGATDEGQKTEQTS